MRKVEVGAPGSRLAAMSLTCPHCGAAPWASCRGRRGARKRVHEDRMALTFGTQLTLDAACAAQRRDWEADF